MASDWTNDWWTHSPFSWGHPGRGGFPFGRGQRFFESGEIRLAILSLLAEGPKHGYQLMKEMAERSRGVYKASAGSIYPTLQQLEDEQLVVGEQQGGRRIYTLTAAGSAELEKDPDAVRRIWKRAGEYEDWGRFMHPGRADLFHSVAGVVKASMHATGRAGADRVREVLDRTRKELEEL